MVIAQRRQGQSCALSAGVVGFNVCLSVLLTFRQAWEGWTLAFQLPAPLPGPPSLTGTGKVGTPIFLKIKEVNKENGRHRFQLSHHRTHVVDISPREVVRSTTL